MSKTQGHALGLSEHDHAPAAHSLEHHALHSQTSLNEKAVWIAPPQRSMYRNSGQEFGIEEQRAHHAAAASTLHASPPTDKQ